jgi:predicted nucleic acid-binding protein
MNGNRFLLDTNAVLYILDGDEVLADFLSGESLYISIITEMELLGYQDISEQEKGQIKEMLSDFIILNIDKEVKEKTIEIKTQTRLKLPDSIIAASAIVFDMPLITADKQFKTVKNLNLLLYEK